MLCESITDFTELNSVQEARWVHGLTSNKASKNGFFSIGRKNWDEEKRKFTWKQDSISMSNLDWVVQATRGQSDTYISQSEFFAKNRQIASFNSVQSCWVDLDYYNDDWDASEWNDEKLKTIIEHGKKLGIPVPSLIVNSGRGAYVKWMFNAPVHQLPLWNIVQESLTVLYYCLSVDVKAKDASRVLRIIDTKNTNNFSKVNVLSGNHVEYEFGEFSKLIEQIKVDEISPIFDSSKSHIRRATKAMKNLVAQIEIAAKGDLASLDLYASLREPLAMEHLTSRSLNWSRFTDLRSIAHQRGGFRKGERDHMLLWMVNSLAQAKVITSANWDGEVNDLIKGFSVGPDFSPVQSGYLSSVQARLINQESGEKKKSILYRPGNNYLISTLEITQAEQVNLKTIIGSDEKNRRLKIKRDRLYDGRAQRRESRKTWKSLAQEKIKSLFDSHMSCGHISNMPSLRGIGFNATSLSHEMGIERSKLSKFASLELERLYSDYKILMRSESECVVKQPEPADSSITVETTDIEVAAPPPAPSLPQPAPAQEPVKDTLPEFDSFQARQVEIQQKALAIYDEQMKKLRRDRDIQQARILTEAKKAGDAAREKLLRLRDHRRAQNSVNQLIGLCTSQQIKQEETIVNQPAVPNTQVPAQAPSGLSMKERLLSRAKESQNRLSPARTAAPHPDPVAAQPTAPTSVKPPAFGSMPSPAPAPKVAKPHAPAAPLGTPAERLASKVMAMKSNSTVRSGRPGAVRSTEHNAGGNFADMPLSALAQMQMQARQNQGDDGDWSYGDVDVEPTSTQPVADPGTRFFAPSKSYPDRYPPGCQWKQNLLPCGSAFHEAEWEFAKSAGRYLVIEMHNNGISLERFIDPKHPDNADITAGHPALTDVYGQIHLMDTPEMEKVVRAFAGCCLVRNREFFRMPEAIEASAAMFNGVPFWVVRPRSQYASEISQASSNSYGRKQYDRPFSGKNEGRSAGLSSENLRKRVEKARSTPDNASLDAGADEQSLPAPAP